MGLLRSFSFGQIHGISEIPDDVLSLFSSLIDEPGKKVEFASEIISAGLQGKIDTKREFNLEAYEAAIRKNQRLGKANKSKREFFLDSTSNSDDVETGGVREDIASAQNASQMEDAYEKLMDEDELLYAISTIKSLQPVLLVEARMDILYTLRQALKQIPESVKMITNLCSDYPILGEQIRVVLSSGFSFEEMFA